MKPLHPLLLLLLSTVSTHAQDTQPRYTGIYYKFIEDAKGYFLLSDTLQGTTTSSTPASFKKNDKVLVTAFPNQYWVEGFKSGKGYFVRFKSLVPFEKPLADAQPATVGKTNTKGTPTSTTPSSSQNIHAGPRGGHYYINSNGNKTYIKRR